MLKRNPSCYNLLLMNPQKIKENFPLVLWAFALGLMVALGIDRFVEDRREISQYVLYHAMTSLIASSFFAWRQSRKNPVVNKYHRFNR